MLTQGSRRNTTVILALCVVVSACRSATSLAALQRVPIPTGAHSLLYNIDLGLQKGLFLRSEFFEDTNLTHFFGASPVAWIRNSEALKIAEMRTVSYLPTHGRSRTKINAMRSVGPDGRVSANAEFICACNLTINDIEDVFGHGGRTITDQIVPTDVFPHSFPVLPPATAPMGNKIVTYTIPTPVAYRSTLEVEFASDGTVKWVRAKQEEVR